MGIIIEFVLELLAELFITGGSERWANRKQRKHEKRLKKWAKAYEWFEYLYKDERFSWILVYDSEVRNMLRDKSYFRSLNLNLEARRQFEALLLAKYTDREALK